MNTHELEGVIDRILSPAGFRRRKSTWYKTNNDTITLVDLQKSQWGGQYYINLAIYLRDLGKAVSPSEHHAHIRVRLSSVAVAEAPAIEEALDLERLGLSTEQRTRVISRALTDVAVPFLEDRSVLAQLRSLHAEGRLGPVMMLRAARELLEVTRA